MVAPTRDGLLPLGVWTHVVVVLSANSATAPSACKLFDTNLNAAIYVDGASVSLTRTVGAYAPLAMYPSSSAAATVTVGAGFVGSLLDVAVYTTPLSAAQVANHTSADALLGLSPSALAPRSAPCNASNYTTSILAASPLVYFPMEGSDAAVADAACGYDATNATFPAGMQQWAFGAGPSSNALSAPAFSGTVVVTSPLPLAVLRPVSSLFLSSGATVGGVTVGLTLEALVFNTVYLAGATVASVDGGVAGTVSLMLGCNQVIEMTIAS